MQQAMGLWRLSLAVLAVAMFSATSSDALPFPARREHSTGAATKRAPATCPAHPLPVASPATLLAKMEPTLERAAANVTAALHKEMSPGGAVLSFVYRDTVLWTKGFGFINMSDPGRGPPTGDTGFRIGSITKVFTALMMLMWRDRGLLPSLDADITTYLPEFKIVNPYQTQRGITFRQLASHMAGLPRNAPCKGIFTTGCNITDEQMYKNLATIELLQPPGSQPSYSNLGFGLLGRVLERVRGPTATWEAQLRLAILDPLNMTNSGNKFTPEAMNKLAVGYYPDGSIADLINIGWDAPAGQMYSSTNDLAELMKLAFRTEESYNPTAGQLIDGETVREWMHPAYVYPDGTGFCLPWELVPLDPFTLLTKPGVLNGYNTEFQMAHENKMGFVLLQSCDGCQSHDDIIGIGQQVLLEANKALEALQPGPSLPPNAAEYAGYYQGTPTDVVTVNYTLVSSHIALVISNGELTNMILEWTQGDAFQISSQGMSEPCYILSEGHIGERVYFQRDSSNKINSLTLPGSEYGRIYHRMF